MDSQKNENLLNLALDTGLVERERSLELNVGYDVQEKTALYYDAVAAALDGKQIDGTAVQLEQEEDGIFLVFRIEAEEGQELLVRLQVNDCWSQETYYEIKTWKVISTDRQEEEKPLNLLPIIQ